jgi:para-nitrobenzyl esterase
MRSGRITRLFAGGIASGITGGNAGFRATNCAGLIGSAVAVLVAASLLSTAPASALTADSGAEVTVADGAVRGTVSADHREFLGIPFAAPPTGDLRFRPPQPAAKWSGVRDATKEGNVCPQSTPVGTVSEDCLVLNVYTPPAAASKNLPVMVWLHGGGYSFGSAAGYDPRPLVTQGKVIVVSVNYRFGPFGFLALPGLAAESKTSGNYGVLDQQAGLRWVQDNVRAFGGNPGNVTIFGESAGGHSVCMQLISPTAKGLFTKAISESGGCVGTGLGPLPTATAYPKGQDFATKVGCTDPATVVACLRGKTMQQILDQTGGGLGTQLGFVPTIDGTVIKESTKDALTSGRYNHVPLIVGTNLNEGRLFVALEFHLQKVRSATATELTDQIHTLANRFTPELLTTYPAAKPDNADLALSSAITDASFACPAAFAVQAALTQPGQTVYQYEFADPNPPLSNLDPFMPLGDYHSSELFYLFRTVQGLPLVLGYTPAQQRLSNQMISYWTTFAKTGNPNAPGTAHWPATTTGSTRIQRLTSAGTAPFSTFSAEHHCPLWAS